MLAFKSATLAVGLLVASLPTVDVGAVALTHPRMVNHVTVPNAGGVVLTRPRSLVGAIARTHPRYFGEDDKVSNAGGVVLTHPHIANRDTVSSFNITFDSDEFDNLGDLDWRPLEDPYEGLSWKNFRVGANKHFFQSAGGKNAFAVLPLDATTKEVMHIPSEAPVLTTIKNAMNLTQVSTFTPESMLFGCALHSGIPVECNVKFEGKVGGRVKSSDTIQFRPPSAIMNSEGRLEAGKAPFQWVHFDQDSYNQIDSLSINVSNYTVLYTPPTGMESKNPIDAAYADSLLLAIDSVAYSLHTPPSGSVPALPPAENNKHTADENKPPKVVSSTRKSPLEERSGHVTDCFDLDDKILFSPIPIPYKDILYDEFYAAKTHIAKSDGKCTAEDRNSTTGYIYAPGVKQYKQPDSIVYPSIGIEYHGSEREDMSIKSFYLGCQQFQDIETVVNTTTPCVIGITSILSQKHGDQAQQVRYQEVSIVEPFDNPAKEVPYQFVELIDGDHVTKIIFFLVAADQNAEKVSIYVDNLTYHTRGSKGNWPHTGNKTIARTDDSRINAMLAAYETHMKHSQIPPDIPAVPEVSKDKQSSQVQVFRRSVQVQYPLPRDEEASTSTFDFTDPPGVDAITGDFALIPEFTKPFIFGPGWRGHAQGGVSSPQQNVLLSNITMDFDLDGDSPFSYAYVQLPWESRSSDKWATSCAYIDILDDSEDPFSFLSWLYTTCFPILENEGQYKDRADKQKEFFECHYTILGYKNDFRAEPAEHAIDIVTSKRQAKKLRKNKLPKNFNKVSRLEVHVTYASKPNVKVAVGKMGYQRGSGKMFQRRM